ncbi:RHS repeat domain-containing protein, partial [Streptomyces eurythermus]
YDPLGRRTAKLRLAEDGETVVERVDFTWDGTTLCEQTTTSEAFPHPITLTWDHQGLRPLAQTERITAAEAPQQEIDSRFFAIITDLVGTPTELIDDQGEITWHTRSTLWGTTAWAATSTTYTPLRFPGQYYDPETGLHYNYFRHYDPETARYLASDPLGLTPAPNPATYVNNPHTWTDPLGLSPCPPEQKVVQTPEVVAPKPLKPHEVLDAWENFLREGPYTNIHPRTGMPDPDRLVSADGWRSIRLGSHEMNSKPTKFHFHMETWTFESPTNTWIVDNTMVRVPLGLK